MRKEGCCAACGDDDELEVCEAATFGQGSKAKSLVLSGSGSFERLLQIVDLIIISHNRNSISKIN